MPIDNKKFLTDLDKFEQALYTKWEEAVKGVVFEVGVSLIERSPVGQPEQWHPLTLKDRPGYEPGLLKNSWSFALDSVPAATRGSADPSGNQSYSDLSSCAMKYDAKVNSKIVMVNTAHSAFPEFDSSPFYAVSLELKARGKTPSHEDYIQAFTYQVELEDGVLAPTMLAANSILASKGIPVKG
jgi:hypothetical protein